MNESNQLLLFQQLSGVWRSLDDKAMEVTTKSADLPDIEHWFGRQLDVWVDTELRMLKEWKDLRPWKQQVADAFARLLTARRRSQHEADGDPDRCVLCGGALSPGRFNRRGCVACSAAVTDALLCLVRASTERYTPEYVHEVWSGFKKRSMASKA